MSNFTRALFAALIGSGLAAAWCPAAPPPATMPANVDAASATGARATMEQAIHDALAALRDPGLPAAQKGQKVSQIVDDRVDFETLVRLALGQYWRDPSETQRTQLVEQLRKHVLATFGQTTDKYTDEDLLVASDRQEPRGDWTVQTRVIGKKDDGGRGEVAKVDFRLRQKDGAWKVIDLTIDGVSMAANFRAQFQDVMKKSGIDWLLKLLREKNASADNADPGSNTPK